MKRVVLLLALMVAAVLLATGVALATSVTEEEPNDTRDTAQNIDEKFSLDVDFNIALSSTVPHASVNGGGGDGTFPNTFDYYSFTVPQQGTTSSTFDIDSTEGGSVFGYDSYLRLFDSNDNVLAFNDGNNNIDLGSRDLSDSYITYTFETPGTYYIEVGHCCIAPVPAASTYRLNVSIPNHVSIPNPSNYDFQGFFSPVDNPDTVNKAKAGSAIPVKFSLGGDQGLDIFADGYPKFEQSACDSSDTSDAIEQTLSDASSHLNYDATTDQYTYVWKTKKDWAKKCGTLIVKLDDGGTEHLANFEFTK